MNFRVVDAMLSVTDKQCFDICLRLSREEGLLTGGSSGLNMHAAVELSGRCNPGAVIVVVLPDSGIKYLSKIYSPEWRQSNGFEDDPVADDTTNGTNSRTSTSTLTIVDFVFGNRPATANSARACPPLPLAGPLSRLRQLNPWFIL